MITNDEERLRASLTFTESTIPDRIAADSEVVENGLAKLVLSIIELVRRLLEKQALRRMDAGNLTDATRLYASAAHRATTTAERDHLTKQAARLNACRQ